MMIALVMCVSTCAASAGQQAPVLLPVAETPVSTPVTVHIGKADRLTVEGREVSLPALGAAVREAAGGRMDTPVRVVAVKTVSYSTAMGVLDALSREGFTAGIALIAGEAD